MHKKNLNDNFYYNESSILDQWGHNGGNFFPAESTQLLCRNTPHKQAPLTSKMGNEILHSIPARVLSKIKKKP